VERIYYDGECGYCHEWVRIVLRYDPEGALFRFAPVQGTTFAARIPREKREAMGDTIVVETEDGRLLVRSVAINHILRRLGFKTWARLNSLAPRPLGDLGYRLAAWSRRAFAPRPRDSCPVVDPTLRARFDP
jgi:predicted DCC family thiol-disulfide oxidoreductase YuxK